MHNGQDNVASLFKPRSRPLCSNWCTCMIVAGDGVRFRGSFGRSAGSAGISGLAEFRPDKTSGGRYGKVHIFNEFVLNQRILRTL